MNTPSIAATPSIATGKVTKVVSTGYACRRIVLDNVRPFELEPHVQLAFEIDNAEFRDHAHTFLLNERGQIVRALG